MIARETQLDDNSNQDGTLNGTSVLSQAQKQTVGESSRGSFLGANDGERALKGGVLCLLRMSRYECVVENDAASTGTQGRQWVWTEMQKKTPPLISLFNTKTC